jgi:hypothetical protein
VVVAEAVVLVGVTVETGIRMVQEEVRASQGVEVQTQKVAVVAVVAPVLPLVVLVVMA